MKKKRAPSDFADKTNLQIFTLRGQRVIFDADLARLYGVPTFRFNETFKRNKHRFPSDFAFQLTATEFADFKRHLASTNRNSSQIAMSSSGVLNEKNKSNGSQFVTNSKSKHRGATYRPWVFTEHGAVMAANVLRSTSAVEMSVYVVRAFIKQREILLTNATILKRLAEVDKNPLGARFSTADSLEETATTARTSTREIETTNRI